MNKVHSPRMTPELLEESARIALLPDDTIDLSDIPELPADAIGERGKFYRPVKQQVTLRLDADIVHWFRTHQKGKRGYQTEINAALRRIVDGEPRKAG